MKKSKKKRLTKSGRQLAVIEAEMLGLPSPVRPPRKHYMRLLSHDPDELARNTFSEELRTIAVELGCPVRRGQPHRLIAEAVARVLGCVTAENAPGSAEGLKMLGEHRLRGLIWQLWNSAVCDLALNVDQKLPTDLFLLPKKKDRLSVEELAARTAYLLKLWDIWMKRSKRHPRDPLPSAEHFASVAEPPPPQPAPKTLRSLNRRVTKDLGPNWSYGYGGEGKETLRCGCRIDRSNIRKNYFFVRSVRTSCAGHPPVPSRYRGLSPVPEMAGRRCSTRDIERAPKKRRAMRDRTVRIPLSRR